MSHARSRILKAIIAAIIILFSAFIYNIFFPVEQPKFDTCPTCKKNYTPPHKKEKLLPLLNPLFNLREMCKQCVLLEQHLSEKEKRCKQCCRKHMLTIEALAEEAIGLDKKQEYEELLSDLPTKVRLLEKRFIDGEDPNQLAQEWREFRKKLVKHCYDSF